MWVGVGVLVLRFPQGHKFTCSVCPGGFGVLGLGFGQLLITPIELEDSACRVTE